MIFLFPSTIVWAEGASVAPPWAFRPGAQFLELAKAARLGASQLLLQPNRR